MAEATLISNTRCHIGENPLWHAEHGALYWCDIPEARLYRYLPGSNATEIVREGTGFLGGFTIEPDGALLLFLDAGKIVRWRAGEPETPLYEITSQRHTRFNDVIADPLGGVFCGTMSAGEHLGALFRLAPDREPTVVCEAVGCSNGMGFSGDLARLYYADSFAGTVTVFDYDRDTGAATNRRDFLHFEPREGLPDGLTVDEEDHLWVALWDGAAVVRIDPAGKEVARFRIPSGKVTSVSFGGEDLLTLFVTTAGGEDRATHGDGAGALYAIKTDVRGRPEFRSSLWSSLGPTLPSLQHSVTSSRSRL